MSKLTYSEYMKWVEEQNPHIFAKLGTKYQVVKCTCNELGCKGFITQFTDDYQRIFKETAMAIATSMLRVKPIKVF